MTTIQVEQEDKFAHCKELLKSRYLAFKIDEDGKKRIIETPEGMFRRVASFLAKNEVEEKYFFGMMYNLDALPNSPTLWGSGMPKTLLSACAVLEVGDDMKDIMRQLVNGVELQALGSGVGYYLGNIRAKDVLVSTSGGKALGVMACLRIYNNTFREIQQGGCVSTESLVITEHGIKPMGDMINSPPLKSNVVNESILTEKGLKPITLVEDNGNANCYKITTSLGNEIVATGNHLVGVIDKHGDMSWKRTDQLTPDDFVIIISGGYNKKSDYLLESLTGPLHGNSKFSIHPQCINKNLAELLGFYIANGGTSWDSYNNGRIFFSVTNKDTDVKE